MPYVEGDAGDAGDVERPLLEKQRHGHRITSQGFIEAEFPVVHQDGCFETNGPKKQRFHRF